MSRCAAHLAPVRFLLGTWHGAGRVGDDAVTSRVVAEPFGADMIRLDNETFRDGETIHRERIVFRVKDDRLQASTSPWRGDAQVFEVEATPTGLVLTCGDRCRWTIVREGDDRWSETFESADSAGRLQVRTTLHHVRTAAG